MDEELDRSDVKTLLDQLKETTRAANTMQKSDFVLNKEDLEQFIVSAPESEDVHSLAELYKASTGAIEALNKILLQQQKAQAQITVKTMDIQAKQAIAERKDERDTFTREEIMEQLLNSGKVIEAEISDTDQEL
jgi:hypothetical protein